MIPTAVCPSFRIEVNAVASRLFETNLVYRIVAFFLALALWVGISVSGNPVEQRIMLIPLEYRNLPQDRMIAAQEDTVNVRIEGRAEDLEFISAQDIVATVDLSTVRIGQNALDVDVRVPASVELVDINPDRASVSIAEIQSVQLPVSASITGYPREGYNTLAPNLSPSEVVVEGPQEWIDAIDRVAVNVILDYETSYDKMLPVQVLDETGADITDRLRIKPSIVQVELPIYSESQILTKPVHVPVVGSPEPGYRLVGIEVTPSEVVVNGEFDAFLDRIYYQTEPVDISGAAKTFSTTRTIQNDNPFVLIEPEEVQVVVKIARD